jgi:phage gpG-like protein
VTIEVRGLEEALEELRGIEARVEDPEPALVEVAADIESFVAERFRTRTAPDGTAWAPLKPHTLKYRKQSGALEESVYARAQGNTIKFGATAPHAGYQQEERPFLPTDVASGPAATLGDEAAQTISDYIVPTE